MPQAHSSDARCGVELTPIVYDKKKNHAFLTTAFGEGGFYEYVVDMFVEPFASAKVDLSMLYSPLKITACCQLNDEVRSFGVKSVLRNLTDMFYYLCSIRGMGVYSTILEMLRRDEGVEEFFDELGTMQDLDDASEYCQQRIITDVEGIPEDVKYAVFVEYPQDDVEGEVLTNMESDELVSMLRKQVLFPLEFGKTRFGKRVMPEGCEWSDVYDASPSISGALCNVKRAFSPKSIDGETIGELPFYPDDGETIISSNWAKRKLARTGEFSEFLRHSHETQIIDLDDADEPAALFTAVDCEYYDFLDPRVEGAFESQNSVCLNYFRPGRIVVFAGKPEEVVPHGRMVGYMRTVAACAFYDMALRGVSQYISDLRLVLREHVEESLLDELLTRANDYGLVYESEMSRLYREIPYGIDFTVFVEPVQGMEHAMVMTALPGGELCRAEAFEGDMRCKMTGDEAYGREPANDGAPVALHREYVTLIKECMRENPHVASISDNQSFRDMDELAERQYDDNVTEHFGIYDGGKTVLCVADITPGVFGGFDERICDATENAEGQSLKRHRRIIAIATVPDDKTEDDAKEAARNAAKAMFYSEEWKTVNKYVLLLEALKGDIDEGEADTAISQCREYAEAIGARGGAASVSIPSSTLFMVTDQQHDAGGYSIMSGDETINSAPRDAIKAIYEDLVATYLKDDGADVVFVDEA